MNHARHLWDNQWFRDLILLLVVAVVLSLAYSLRAILLPIVMALALAYAFHPLISWLQRKARIPRWLSTTGLLAITCAGALSLMLWLTPQLINQTQSLLARLPGYTNYAAQKMEDLQKWAEPSNGQVPDASAPGDAGNDSTTQPSAVPGETSSGGTASNSASHAQAKAAPAGQESGVTIAQIAPLAEVVLRAAADGMDSRPAAARAHSQEEAAAAATQPTTQSATATTLPATLPQTSLETFPETYSATLPAETAATQASPTSQPAGKGGQAALSSALGKIDLSTIGAMALQTFNIGLGVVVITMSVGMYLALAVMLLLLGFFFFCWKFDRILQWFDGFIPDSHRPRILHILGRMDQAISAFVRGRLVQVSILTCVLCAGWAWVGVPYWLLLGVLAGVLNIVPYAAMLAWPVAVLLMWIDTASGSSGATFTISQVFIWPSVVYIIAQGMDGWVVEPLVQGKATNLDPFSVLVAVIIGGSLLGIMGTIIAVPTAACLKIFLEEVVLPHVQREIHKKPLPSPLDPDAGGSS